MEQEFEKWRNAVLAQVRFKPDRWDIGRELDQHYEDHCKDLTRLGYAPALAAERTLVAMGDAEEVGRAMDRAHKPWLGWLWEASRGLILVMLVVMLGMHLGGHTWPSLGEWSLFYREDERVTQRNEEMTPLACPAPIQAGAYTIRVDRGWYQVQQNGRLYVELDVVCTSRRFWLEAPDLYDALEAVDSDGVRYLSWRYPRVEAFKNGNDHGYTRTTMTIDSIEGRPAWIEITHPMGGWSFRIALPEGEEDA